MGQKLMDELITREPLPLPSLQIPSTADAPGLREPAGELIADESELRKTDFSRLLLELEGAKRGLSRSRDRIAELTVSQNHLNGTVRRLTELASTDVLTGLSNRRSFEEALAAAFALAIRQNSPLSVVMLDVDLFKSYNDTYGHGAGDLVLSTVAKQLIAMCSCYDVVARYGGEEFAVLLPAADAAQALECAERQRNALESYPWPLRRVTASFGVSTLGPDTRDAMMLLEEADRSLYDSKRNGRNRVIHHKMLAPDDSTTGQGSARHSSAGYHRESSEVSRMRMDLNASVLPARRLDSSFSGAIEDGPTPRTPPPDPTSNLAAWEAVQHFIRELQDGKPIPDQYRTALSAVCAGTGARLSFLYSEQNALVLETAGEDASMSHSCREIAIKLIEELPQGGLWESRDAIHETVLPDRPVLSSAAVLRVETPRPAMLFALRFDRGRPFVPADLQFMQVIWQLQSGHKRHSHVHENLKETLFGVVRCLSTAIDAKDPFTCGHSERVARIAVRLGEEMLLSRGEISDLYLAGLLHDVGKIGIRDDVLRKEGALTPEEYDHIKEHPVIGERIISNVTRLAYLRPGIRGHHERYDGKGYPDGLATEDIPLMARILAVADACDAMMSNRRYRAALSQVKIEEIVKLGSGTQWDPRITAHFLSCRHELYAVCQRGLGQSVYAAIERAAGGDISDRRRQ
jgi:diguanylate cyclase (GGDEF)-like protein